MHLIGQAEKVVSNIEEVLGIGAQKHLPLAPAHLPIMLQRLL